MSGWIQATMQQNTISFDWLISNAPYYCFPSNYSIDFKAETIKFIKLVFGFKTPLIGRIYYCHNSLQRQEKLPHLVEHCVLILMQFFHYISFHFPTY